MGLIIVLIFYYGLIPGFKSVNTDFPNYYVSSRMFIEGKDLSAIYDNRDFQKEADLYGISNTIVSYVPHSPSTMILYAPFAKISPIVAKRAFTILGIVLILGAIYFSTKTFKIPLMISSLIFLSLLIPIANNFLFGQPYIFIVFTICLSLYLWNRKMLSFAGFILGLSASIKPFALVFIIPIILHKQWKALIGFIIGIALANIPIFILSPEIYGPYFNTVLPALMDGNIQNPFHYGFGTISVFLRNLFVQDPFRNPDPLLNSTLWYYYSKTFLYLVFICSFALIDFFIKKNTEDDAYRLSLYLILAFLLAPITSSYQYVLLAVPLMAIVSRHKIVNMIVLFEIIFFYFMKQIFQFPYSDLLFLLILFGFIIHKENPVFFRAQIKHAIAYALILIIPAGYSFYRLQDLKGTDNAEPVTSVETKGFPGELRAFGENIYFTEIVDNRYQVNLNGVNLGFKDIDIFSPSILKMDDYLLMSCYMAGGNISKLVLLAENNDQWSVLWKMDYGKVIDTELADWYLSPIDGLALIFIEGGISNDMVQVSWPLQSKETEPLIIKNAWEIRWNREINDALFLHLDSYEAHPEPIYQIVKSETKKDDETSLSNKIIMFAKERKILDFDVSPSGNYIALSMDIPKMGVDLYLLNCDTLRVVELTSHPARDYSPAFYATRDSDGDIHEYVYFISERGGGLNDGRIYRIELTKEIFNEID